MTYTWQSCSSIFSSITRNLGQNRVSYWELAENFSVFVVVCQNFGIDKIQNRQNQFLSENSSSECIRIDLHNGSTVTRWLRRHKPIPPMPTRPTTVRYTGPCQSRPPCHRLNLRRRRPLIIRRHKRIQQLRRTPATSRAALPASRCRRRRSITITTSRGGTSIPLIRVKLIRICKKSNLPSSLHLHRLNRGHMQVLGCQILRKAPVELNLRKVVQFKC